jgi:transposase-like protein
LIPAILRDKNIMLNESKFLELYKRQRESGLNIKDFCSNESVKESTFYYWRKKLHDERKLKDFIPVVVKSPQPASPKNNSNGQPRFHNPASPDNEIFLELVYPNGTKLRLKNDIDLSQLRTLISLFD